MLGGRLRAAIPMRPSTDRPTEVVNERSRRHRQVEGDALNPKSNSMETEESGRALERRGCKKYIDAMQREMSEEGR